MNIDWASVLREVEDEIPAVEENLFDLQRLRKFALRKLGLNAAEKPEAPVVNGEAGSISVGDEFADSTQYRAAFTVLERTTGPLTTNQIAETLIAGGYRAKSEKALRASLYSIMLKNPNDFKRVGPGTWALAANDKSEQPQ
jgi:hypothetical protein